MEFPQVFVFEDATDEERAAKELAELVGSLGFEAPFVLASPHGEKLAAQLAEIRAPETPRPGADQGWSAELGSRAKRAGADVVVAIGGGRCIDLAKLAGARAGIPLIVAPTQLSHDGICSPVAVIPDETGRTESLGAIEPKAVFVSLATLVGAPSASMGAGLGDLLANPLALRDWKLAADHGLDEIDASAWEMSVEAYEMVDEQLDSDPSALATDPGALRHLADALVLSGKAMIASGTSRPASGGEHEISHALDDLHGGPAMHGAQVAFGCIVSVALYDEDTARFRERLKRLHLPQEPADLGLSEEDLVRVLLEAPNTRPGRFTILEDADLDEAKARALVRAIWGH